MGFRLLILLIVLCTVLPCHGVGQEEDEISFIQKLEKVRNASTNPVEMFTDANEFLETSKQKNGL